MDIASSIKILNNIIISTTNVLGIIEVRIEKQDEEIKQETLQLKESTSKIVSIEEEIKKKNNEIDDIKEKQASINSELLDLQHEIDEMRVEIDECAEKIENKENFRGSELDILNHMLNPLGALASDIIGELVINIKDLKKKIDDNQSQINMKQEEMNKLQSSQEENAKSILTLNENINSMVQLENSIEIKIKELGVEKTNSENLLLKLKQLKSRCQQLIDDSEQGKDLLSVGVNLVDELLVEAKELYSQNSFKIDF
ncbi:hypothetical protein ACTFIZ_011764 [Dictyostelium cf. discoideum]